MPDLLALSSWKGPSRAVLFVLHHLLILRLFSLVSSVSQGRQVPL